MPALPVQAPVEVAAQPAVPTTFDLRYYEAERAATDKLLDPRGCGGGSADEIVVCAPDQRKFRLRRDTASIDDSRFDTTMTLLPGLTVTPHVDAAQLQSGVQSNRAMVTFKLKM